MSHPAFCCPRSHFQATSTALICFFGCFLGLSGQDLPSTPILKAPYIELGKPPPTEWPSSVKSTSAIPPASSPPFPLPPPLLQPSLSLTPLLSLLLSTLSSLAFHWHPRAHRLAGCDLGDAWLSVSGGTSSCLVTLSEVSHGSLLYLWLWFIRQCFSLFPFLCPP